MVYSTKSVINSTNSIKIKTHFWEGLKIFHLFLLFCWNEMKVNEKEKIVLSLPGNNIVTTVYPPLVESNLI